MKTPPQRCGCCGWTIPALCLSSLDFQAVEAVASTLRVTPYRHDVIVTEDPGLDWQCRHTEHLHLWIQSQYH